MEFFFGFGCVGLIIAVAIAVGTAVMRGTGHALRLDRLEEEHRALASRLLMVEQSLRREAAVTTPMTRHLSPASPIVAAPTPAVPAPAAPTLARAPSAPPPTALLLAQAPAQALSDFALPSLTPVSQATPAPVTAQRTNAPSDPSWEERIGGQWLNWLGAITLVVAVGLLLKWVYDLGLLAPLLNLPRITWVILGWIAGGGLVAAGLRMRRSLLVYGQALTGTGVAILYVATYTGLFYGVLSFQAAIPAMAVAGLLALGLAWRNDEPSLAWLGVASAYIGPLLLGMKGAGYAELFLYVTGLNVAVLALSVLRPWSSFRLAALFATAALYWVWSLSAHIPGVLGGAAAFLAINSGLLVAAVAAFTLRTGERSREIDLVAAALNPVLTTVAFAGLFPPGTAQSGTVHALGWVAGVSAVVYWALSRLLRRRTGDDETPDFLEQLWFAASVAFVVLAVLWSFGARAITPAWAILGTVLVVAGYGTQSLRTRTWGLGVLALSTGRLVFWDVLLGTAGPMPFLDERSLAFAAVILGCGIAAGVAARAWRHGTADEEVYLISAAVVAAGLADFWIGQELTSLNAPIGWSAVAGLVLAFGWQLRSMGLRAAGLLFGGLSVGQVSLWALQGSGPLAFADLLPRMPALLAAATFGLGAAWKYARPGRVEAPERDVALPIAAAATAAVLSAGSWMALPGGWLSVAWLTGVASLVWAARATSAPTIRALAIALAACLTLEALARQLGLPGGTSPLFHHRSAALLSAVAAWILIALAVKRDDAGEDERALQPVAWGLANLLALGWVSLEAMDVSPRLGPAAWSAAAAQFGLSAGWLLYAGAALAWGFARSQREVRWGGMALLLLTVAKVYLFDLSFLALGYRVLSFMVLAAMLLAVSYAYQRKERATRAQTQPSN